MSLFIQIYPLTPEPHRQRKITRIMQLQLLEALKLSYRASNQEEISVAEQTLKTLSNSGGYIPNLLTVINSQQVDFELTIAALAQLKNYLRAYWPKQGQSGNHGLINPEDSKCLLESLMLTFSNISDNHKYAELLIDITSLIGKAYCSYIRPSFRQFFEEEPRICLQILVGIARCYRYCSDKTLLAPFLELVHTVLPDLLHKMIPSRLKMVEDDLSRLFSLERQAHPFWELFYLTTKFACKTLNFEPSPALRELFLELGHFCLDVLLANCQQVTVSPRLSWNDLPKGSTLFYFCHSLKWSLKYVEKVVNKIVFQSSFKQVSSLYPIWSSSELLDRMISILQQDTLQKLRYQQLKLIEELVTLRPQLFSGHLKQTSQLMAVVIPFLAMLSDKDKELAEQDPAAFIEFEKDNKINKDFESPRIVAISIWTLLAVIPLTCLDQVPKDPLVMGFELINQWVFSESEEKKQVGLHLLATLNPYLRKFEFDSTIKQIFQHLDNLAGISSKWVIIRIIDVVSAYSDIIGDNILLYFRNAIVDCLLNYQSNLKGLSAIFLIKGTFALGNIFSKDKLCLNLTSDTLRDIFKALLAILDQFEFEEVMNSFQRLVVTFGLFVSDFGVELVEVMRTLILDYINKDQAQYHSKIQTPVNDNYIGIADTSTKTLLTLVPFLTSSTSATFQQELEDTILHLFTVILSSPSEGSEQYMEFVLPLLTSYLEYLPKRGLTDSTGFLCRALAFKLAIMPVAIRRELEGMADSNKKQILTLCAQTNYSGLQEYVQVFRSMVRHFQVNRPLLPLQEISANLLGCTDIEVFEYLITSFFKDRKSHSSYQDQGRVFGLLQMIYLLQVHGSTLCQVNHPVTLLDIAFQIVIKVCRYMQAKSFMAKYVLQLFCLWVYFEREQKIKEILSVMNIGSKIMEVLFNNKVTFGLRDITMTEQRNRAILGIGKLIYLMLHNPQLKFGSPATLKQLSTWIIYLVYQNIFEDPLISDERFIPYLQPCHQPKVNFPMLSSQQAQSDIFGDDWQRFSQSSQFCDYELDEHIQNAYGSEVSSQMAEEWAIHVLKHFYQNQPCLYNQCVLSEEDTRQQLKNVFQYYEIDKKQGYSEMLGEEGQEESDDGP